MASAIRVAASRSMSATRTFAPRPASGDGLLGLAGEERAQSPVPLNLRAAFGERLGGQPAGQVALHLPRPPPAGGDLERVDSVPADRLHAQLHELEAGVPAHRLG